MSFTAKHGAPCGSPVRARRIDPGDAVVYVDHELLHDECAADTTLPAPPARAFCQNCFTEVSVSGAHTR
ncbi:hypothetical protein [Streptomyces sp. NPDC093149]|uniref:hypothetical protein n=1 Tax=Streptomyces sp. NPDC093149 TaxID=3366031 RepID=UPI0038196382